jgi:hypothetical protein
MRANLQSASNASIASFAFNDFMVVIVCVIIVTGKRVREKKKKKKLSRLTLRVLLYRNSILFASLNFDRKNL